MIKSLVVLLLAVILPSQVLGRVTHSYYPSGYRKWHCPHSSSKFDDCVREYQECVGRERLVDECVQDICICATTIENDMNSYESGTCRNLSTIPCRLMMSRTESDLFLNSFKEESRKRVIDKIKSRFGSLEYPIEMIEKGCSTNLDAVLEHVSSKIPKELRFVLPLFVLSDIEIVETEQCRAAMTIFETHLKKVDADTATKLKFSYHFWSLGTEYGPAGRVGMRMMAAEACGMKSLDFNMDAAVFVNCYDMQNSKEECDETYFESLKMHLSHMGGNKMACRMFVEFIEQLFASRSDRFYQEAREYDGGSSDAVQSYTLTSGFEGFVDGNMKKRDTKNNYIRLSVLKKPEFSTRRLFANVSRECGNVTSESSDGRRKLLSSSAGSVGIVALCGFMYERCKQIGQENCTTNLPHCLQNIDGLHGSCQEAVTHLSRFIRPRKPLDMEKDDDVATAIAVTSSLFSNMTTSSFSNTYTFVLAVFVFFVASLTIWKFYYKKRKESSRNSSTIVNQEDRLSTHETFEATHMHQESTELTSLVSETMDEEINRADSETSEDGNVASEVHAATGVNDGSEQVHAASSEVHHDSESEQARDDSEGSDGTNEEEFPVIGSFDLGHQIIETAPGNNNESPDNNANLVEEYGWAPIGGDG